MAAAHVVSPSSALPDRVLIAKVSKTTIVLVALLSIPAILTFANGPALWSAAAVLGHLAVVMRVSQIRLSVSPAGVRVQNFFAHTLVPLWEADPALETHEETVFLSDSGGRMDNGARTLFIDRPWQGTRLNVGAAPRFGNEPERICDELCEVILSYRRFY